MGVFRVEGDVRAWLKGAGGDRVFWVEPGRGGTYGLPDCLLAAGGGVTVWLEVKLGWWELGEEGEIVGVGAKLRPVQRITLRRACMMGLPVGMLVGVEGRRSPIVVRLTELDLGPKRGDFWALKRPVFGTFLGDGEIFKSATCTGDDPESDTIWGRCS